MKRFTKIATLYFFVPFTILLTGIFIGVNLNKIPRFRWPTMSQLSQPKQTALPVTTTILSTTPSPQVESSQMKKWKQLVSNKKYLSCYRSERDMTAKLAELQVLYAQVLGKEINNESLSKRDEYIKWLHGWFTARSDNYALFQDPNITEIPSERKIDTITELLEYIYCPQVSMITTNYPTNPASCIEVSLTWMNPFEVPNRQSFQLSQEFELAKKKFTEQLQNAKLYAQDCCTGKVDSGSNGACPMFRSWMQE